MKKYKSSGKARIKRTTYYDEKQRFNPEFLAKRAVRVLTHKLIRVKYVEINQQNVIIYIMIDQIALLVSFGFVEHVM